MKTNTMTALQKEVCRILLDLQNRGIMYFLQNQLDNGLILDRQKNHGPRLDSYWTSTAATGMGLIAIALAASKPYGLISKRQAAFRIGKTLDCAKSRLPRLKGIAPHFVDGKSLQTCGFDAYSTIDTAWLIAGALISTKILKNSRLLCQAYALYRDIDWRYWSTAWFDKNEPLILHGAHPGGQRFKTSWDRLNAETAFMYLLAIGANENKALSPQSWHRLGSFVSTTGNQSFASADLGLFTSQYSLEILSSSKLPFSNLDLAEQARKAALANHFVSSSAAKRFRTYEKFWGLSAGDGPDGYIDYSPDEHDGTANLTASLASIAVAPELVMSNVRNAVACNQPPLLGKYGFSNVNLDKNWRSEDIVGIDVGMAVMAIDNFFHKGRIRQAFHSLRAVQNSLKRLGNLNKTQS